MTTQQQIDSANKYIDDMLAEARAEYEITHPEQYAEAHARLRWEYGLANFQICWLSGKLREHFYNGCEPLAEETP